MAAPLDNHRLSDLMRVAIAHDAMVEEKDRATGEKAIIDHGSGRIPAVNTIITYLFETETLETWSLAFARRLGRPDLAEDLFGVITERLTTELRTISAAQVARIDVLSSFMFAVCRSAARTYVDSGAVSMASSMANVNRRRREARKGAAELRSKLNRDPTTGEVIEYVNAKMTAARVDAAKQGVLISAADLSDAQVTAYSLSYASDDTGEAADWFGAPVEGEAESVGEVAVTIDQMRRYAIARFPGRDGARVSEGIMVWSQLVMDGETPTATAIAKIMGLTRHESSQLVVRIDTVVAWMRGPSAAPAA